MSAPAAPLEKARTILHRVYLQLGSQAPAEYNEAVEALLAALYADRKPCEPGVICPTCVALEDAENALKEVRFMTEGFKSWTLEDKVCGIARRYFARREEKEVPE